ncbi:hypothetical protein [Enterocloster asparagiformis]|uniref:hypothetical protein n=1 Tax=Enterocloster asparagiformis TaxID=333367 RepID=UPI002A7EEC7B|nr:hypothetical protein [Enterocloster asparagiformis]
MKRAQMEAIAARAARLAVSNPDAVDGYMTEQRYYEEYLDQLRTGDTLCLRSWIGQEIEAGCREAVEIMKMWIRAELPVTA